MLKRQSFNIDDIVRDYADTVYRIAKIHTNQTSDAEDVFQEVFLKLVKHLHHLHDAEHIKAWLIRVTINCCKSFYSSAWSRRAVLMDKEMMEIQGDDNSDRWELTDNGQDVYEAVKQLPHIYRDVIHLFYFEELSIREISQLLKRKETTIKSQLSRARSMLAKDMNVKME